MPSIEIHSPSDCFVVSLFVSDGQKVSVGDKLLQFDTDEEDRVLAKLTTTQLVNEVTARKYQLGGEQLNAQWQMAQQAVDLAAAAFKDASTAYDGMNYQGRLGTQSSIDVANSKLQADKAEIQLQISQTNLAKLKFSAKNYQDSAELVKQHIEAEKAAISSRRDRKLVTAPIAGEIVTEIYKGAFLKLGKLAMVIKA